MDYCEQEETLELDWLPERLASIFEDSHADCRGQWETIDTAAELA